MYFIEKVSQKLGCSICSSLKLDKDQEDIIIYGAICLIQIMWSILCIIIVSSIFNVLMEASIICFTIALLRKYSGGVHASTPNRCNIASVFIITSFALIIRKINLKFNLVSILFLLLSFLLSYYIVRKFAPVDSEAKPIRDLKTKHKLKKYSTIILVSLFTIISILLIFHIKFKIYVFFIIIQCILAGVLWQCFTLTPTAHKIFNKIKCVLNN